MTATLHVAYVDPADPGDASLGELVERWWSTRVTMAAVAATGVRVSVLFRSRHGAALLRRDDVEFRTVADDRFGVHTARAVRALRPHVVHANGFVFPTRTLVLHALNPRVPVVLQHHGEPPAPAGSRSARLQAVVGRRIRAALFTGSQWGAADPWIARAVLHPSIVHDVVETVVPGTVRDRDEARHRTGLTGTPSVLWVGRNEPVKDPLTMVRAAERAAAELPGLELWMVGPGGSLDAEVAAAVAASPLGSRIHRVGPVDRLELPWWFAAADIVGSTSRSEGSGYALLEAIASGAGRIVASDLPSHRSILGSLGPCGPAPGDVEATSAALVDAWRRPPRLHPLPDPAAALVALYRSVALTR